MKPVKIKKYFISHEETPIDLSTHSYFADKLPSIVKYA